MHEQLEIVTPRSSVRGLFATRAVFYGKLKPEFYGPIGSEFSSIIVRIYEVSWESPSFTFKHDLNLNGFRLGSDGFIGASGLLRPHDALLPDPTDGEPLYDFNVYPATTVVTPGAEFAHKALNKIPTFSNLIRFREDKLGPVRLSDVLSTARINGIRELHCFLNYTATFQKLGGFQ